MRMRRLTILGVVCALALSALAMPAPASAQETSHYTFVSFWAVPRAQWSDFEKADADTNAILGKLVADGRWRPSDHPRFWFMPKMGTRISAGSRRRARPAF